VTAPRPAVFLDRDGTIIADKHYLCDPAGVELLPGAAEGLHRMSALGLPLVVVSNQSGVGRGYYDAQSVERVNTRLAELLLAHGVVLAGSYYCPHAPQQVCDCRKPAPGLALMAAHDLCLDLGTSYVVGDKPCDVELGLAVGATALLVYGGNPKISPEEAAACGAHGHVRDLNEAAAWIEDHYRRRS